MRNVPIPTNLYVALNRRPAPQQSDNRVHGPSGIHIKINEILNFLIRLGET